MSLKNKLYIDEPMRANQIKNQQTLLAEILQKIGCKNIDEEIKNQKGNFSKMISGERPLRNDFIIPMEEILNTSIYALQSGKPVPMTFQNKGIRYAAFMDDVEEYEKLYADGNLTNFDEYDQSALDYIFSYHAINGLRFVAKEEKMQLDYQGKYLNGNISLSGKLEDAPLAALNLVCERGDPDLFDSIFNPFVRMGDLGWQMGMLADEASLRTILGSEKIFKSLLIGKDIKLKEINPGLINEKDKGRFVNPLLFDLVNFVLYHEKEFPRQVEQLLTFGINFNQQSIKYINDNFSEDYGFKVSESGLIKSGRTVYGSILTTKLVSQPDLTEGSFALLNELNKGVNGLTFKSKPVLGGFSKSNVRVENGLLVKKSSDNKTEYEFLKLMAKNNVNLVPKLMKQEGGLDYLTYFQGAVPGSIKMESIKKLSGIAKALRFINDISKENLGNGKVYVHDDFSVMNMVFNGDDLVGIIDWDTTKVGEDYEDFVYLLWTGLNIGDHLRDDEDIFNKMKDILKAYGADEVFKKGWADKMISVMDGRLSRVGKSALNYRRIFEWVGWSKLFVELYRDRIGKEIG